MKFKNIDHDIPRQLKLKNTECLTFKILDLECFDERVHLVGMENTHKIEKCIGENCQYCITARTLMKLDLNSRQAIQLWAKTFHYFAVLVEENKHDITPGEYFWRFGKQIHDAYKQLLIFAEEYKIIDKQRNFKEIYFTPVIKMKHDFPDYTPGYFTFKYNNKKVHLTVAQLLDDSRLDRVTAPYANKKKVLHGAF